MAEFKEKLEQVIEPYLQKYRKEFWMEREEGKKLHCMSYCLENPKGVIVFSHGYTEYEEKCRESIYYLLKGNYSVYFMEHCGHGFSYRLVKDLSKVHVDSFERYVDDFIFFAEKAKEENPELPLYILGHSMGGGIAACVITKAPKLFEKAVLSSPMIRPNTGDKPWPVAAAFTKLNCMKGCAEDYMIGGPYQGKGEIDRSCCMRDDKNLYYMDRKDEEIMYQTSGGSFGWMNAAVDMNVYLRRQAPKKIQIPVLLFQAEGELLVSNEEQIHFIKQLRRAGLKSAKLVKVPNAKHEIYNAEEPTYKAFWRMIHKFYEQEA